MLLQPTQAAWREVFFIAAAVYIAGATFYLVFASGVRQSWDDKRFMKENKTGKITEDSGTGNCTNGMCGVANGTFEEISKH